MKASYLFFILMLLIPAYGVHAGRTKSGNSNQKQSVTVSDWPVDCVVNVYFVEKMFTANEKQMIWSALDVWTQKAKKIGRGISFVPAGETGGLIDCVGCLTIARSGSSSDRIRQRVSFNALRQDQTGRLVSAWIGFEGVGNRVDLRALLLLPLERGLSLNGLQTASGGRR